VRQGLSDESVRPGEARVEESADGLRPSGAGWFVVNVGELAAKKNERMGVMCSPEPEDVRFEEFGVNLRVLEPGQFNARYHRENAQEAFLVLSGECVLVVEGQERLLRSGDFFHSPPLTGHVFVGAGERRCTILMIGGRTKEWREGEGFPVDATAARYGASVTESTRLPEEAYADIPVDEAARLPWPPSFVAGSAPR
jgi:mannose-6-phosphate isomerase-like protein (cupin superfamily)